MTDIIIEISLYLSAAILLGFTFGWFISKSIFKERYEKQANLVADEPSMEETQHSTALVEGLKVEVSEQKEKLDFVEKMYESEMEAFLLERTKLIEKQKFLEEKLRVQESLNGNTSIHDNWKTV